MIQKEIQNALAMRLLTGEVREGDTVHVGIGDEEFIFTSSREPEEEQKNG